MHLNPEIERFLWCLVVAFLLSLNIHLRSRVKTLERHHRVHHILWGKQINLDEDIIARMKLIQEAYARQIKMELENEGDGK